MTKDDVLNILFVIFMCLVFLDIFSTQYLVFFGDSVEANVVMAHSMSILGYLWWIPKMLFSYSLAKLLVILRKEIDLFGISVLMSLICGHNLYYVIESFTLLLL